MEPNCAVSFCSAAPHLIEAFLDPMEEDSVPQARVHIGICGDDTQQGGHVGVDHAAALGNPPHPHLLAQDFSLHQSDTCVANSAVCKVCEGQCHASNMQMTLGDLLGPTFICSTG